MDFQTLINWGAGAGLAALGWFARQLWDANKEMREDLARLREELPTKYVTKDDFKDALRELKDMLVTIGEKIDRKADK